jgi:hypothetical protein
MTWHISTVELEQLYSYLIPAKLSIHSISLASIIQHGLKFQKNKSVEHAQVMSIRLYNLDMDIWSRIHCPSPHLPYR